MKEKEAIVLIKRTRPKGNSSIEIQLNAALDMAISALENQTPKKAVLCMNEVSGMFIDYSDGHGEYKTQMNNWWRCPCCNSVVGQRVIVHKRTHDQRKKNYCEKCGQAINWNESEEA